MSLRRHGTAVPDARCYCHAGCITARGADANRLVDAARATLGNQASCDNVFRMTHRMSVRLVIGVFLSASVGLWKPLVRPTVVKAAEQRLVPAVVPSPDTVTVVGFFNITGAAEDVWIGGGTAEAIVAHLAGTGVSVVLASDGSTAGPLGGELVATPIPNDEASVAAGRRVGARWMVGGAFQRLGDRVRLTGHIVDVETEVVVYATTVDGAMMDLFALQDELAEDLRQGVPVVPEVSHRMVAPTGSRSGHLDPDVTRAALARDFWLCTESAT